MLVEHITQLFNVKRSQQGSVGFAEILSLALTLPLPVSLRAFLCLAHHHPCLPQQPLHSRLRG